MTETSCAFVQRLALPGLTLAALLWAGGLKAQEDLDIVEGPRGTATYQVLFENDSLANTDQGYTNGLQLSRMRSGREELPKWARPILRRFQLCVADPTSSERCYNIRSGFVLGQLMYTPEDISNPLRIPADRPYAGWLYGGVVTELVDDDRSHSHRFEIDIGVLGPESQADDTQIFIHETFGFTEPRGWDNQVDTEVGVVLQYDYRRALLKKDLSGGARLFDLSGSVGATAGNIFANAHLSAIARLGYNLSDVFPETISPVGWEPDDFEIYIFVGATARGVLINETIEGQPLHPVEAEAFVNDVTWGGVARMGGYRLQFVIVTRSPEYTPSSRQHRYGSLGFSWSKSF